MATMSAVFIATMRGRVGAELAKEFDTLMGTPGTMSNRLYTALEAEIGRGPTQDLQANITSRGTLKASTLVALESMLGNEQMQVLNGQA